MLMIFHVEHGCLGPNGKDRIELFCKYFSKYAKTALGDIGIQIFASPRTPGDPEFRYVTPDNPHNTPSSELIQQRLEKANLTRPEFEEGLSDLAASYAESDEWQQLVKTHFQ